MMVFRIPSVLIYSISYFVIPFQIYIWQSLIYRYRTWGLKIYVASSSSYLECLHLDNFSFLLLMLSIRLVYASLLSLPAFSVVSFSFKPHFIKMEGFHISKIIFSIELLLNLLWWLGARFIVLKALLIHQNWL